MLKKITILVLLSCLLYIKASASHFMGGEITWECQGNGQYIFTLKFYRDCNGNAADDSVTMYVFNNPLLDSINLRLFSKKDISPNCNGSGPAISCAAAETQPGWPHASTIVAGAVQESVFKSYPITLSGVPPPKGWIFTYSDCCRNVTISNIDNSGLHGYTLRAVMHAYAGRNEGPCFDSSPTFLESPSSIICLGYPFTYNHNASDADLDSLSYSWAKPLDSFGGEFQENVNPQPLAFVKGYSAESPLPGTTQNPNNVPAAINAATGEISFTSFTQGYFMTVVKVEAWKCGQLVSEIYREMQIVLLPCAANEKPKVTFSTHKDTVKAGELVTFTVHGNDPGFLSNGTTPQTLTMTASGTQFGTGFTSTTTGCAHPPCATLTPAAPITAPTDVYTTFSWQTACSHVASQTGCNPHTNTYTFVFKTQDDFCPAPAQNISTISITVLATPTVPSPQPRCVAVLPNGDVTLTWTPALDKVGTFNSYHIYSAASPAGPFKVVDSVFTLSQTTYTHIGANANTAPVYYYIRTRSGCGGREFSPALDTVNSIFLKVVNPANGTALLSWNTIAKPPIVSSSGIYKIYMEYPAGVWGLVGQTTSTNYVDSITVCNSQVNYRVEIADTTGCTSVSSVAGSVFKNTIVPFTPALDTLSVDDNNKIILSWFVSPSKDVNAYVIYKQQGSSAIPIDTVFGYTTTFLNYLLSNPDAGVEGYLIAAIDSCGNIGLLGTIYKTMHLKAIPDICNRSASLTWTASNPIGTGLAGYRIYQSTAGTAGPYTLIGTVSATTLTFSAPGLLPNATYYYKVQAFDQSSKKTASSNRILFYSRVPTPPKFSYLRKATVTAPNVVDITCHVDPQASSLRYKVMRSDDNKPSTYREIGVVPALKATPVFYTDNTALTASKSYYYKIINVDSCGFDGQETNIGRTILLTATANNAAFTNTLKWNDYENWSGNVTSYNIYRGMDGIIDPTPIANVPFTGGVNTYVDDISTQVTGQGIFDYYVEALEGIGNVYGFTENSVSNIAEAYQDPIIYIPNAFVPVGEEANKIFLPVTTFVDFTDYEFTIFDRWGRELFTTKNVSQGWDGKTNGKPCEFGVYVYVLRYKTSRGEYLQYKGTVTLIR
jgi:gliding motility-associated-like protein